MADTGFKTWEIILALAIIYVPLIPLAIYPFRRRLRFSMPVTCIACVILAVAQIRLMYMSVVNENGVQLISNTLSAILFVSVMVILVDEDIGKLMFNLLIILNFGNLVVVMSKFLEGIMFHGEALQYYRWTYSVCALIVQFIMVPLYVKLVNSIFQDVIDLNTMKNEWSYLWLVPGTFYLVLMQNAYSPGQSTLEKYMSPSFALVTLAINIGAFLVYWIIADIIMEREENLKLERENNILMEQNRQYDDLSEKIKAARRNIHDVRHHYGVLKHVAETKDWDMLNKYLEEYHQNLVPEKSLVYCNNPAANTALNYYAQITEQEGIPFDVKFTMEDDMGITDMDISILIGNLLENALEATRRVEKDKRFINVASSVRGDTMFIVVDNSYAVEPQVNEKGEYNSTKHSGKGVGIESVRNIAEKYNGSADFTASDGVFGASVMITAKKDDEAENQRN